MSDFTGKTPQRDNIDNNGDDNLRQVLNRELNIALDQPQYQSRRTAIMAQLKAEQFAVPLVASAAPPTRRLRWFFNAPTWAGAMVAVFVLVMGGLLFAIVAGNVAQKASVTTVGQAQESTFGAADGASRLVATAAPAANSAPRPTVAAAGAVAAATTALPAAATTAAAPAARATTAAAAVATTAAAAATTAPAATAAIGQAPSQALPAPTTTPLNANVGGGISATAAPGSPKSDALNPYPGATVVTIEASQLDNLLNSLVANQSTTEKNNLRLNAPFAYNYQAAKAKGVTAEQVATFYLNQLKSPAYNVTSVILRDDTQVKVQWLVFSTPDSKTALAVLLVEPKQVANFFDANIVSIGETLIVEARPK